MFTSPIAQAVTLIQSGKKAAARQILLKYLQSDARNENAWLWLAYTYTDARRRYCLERALEINPHNLQTQHVITKMNRNAQPKAEPIPAVLLPSGTILFSPNLLSFLIVRPLIVHLMLMLHLYALLTTHPGLHISEVLIATLYALNMLMFAVVLLSPVFRVEITQTHLIGPARVNGKLTRIKVPIRNLETQHAPGLARLLGVYTVSTCRGSKIFLPAFKQNQYHQLLDLIRARKALARH